MTNLLPILMDICKKTFLSRQRDFHGESEILRRGRVTARREQRRVRLAVEIETHREQF